MIIFVAERQNGATEFFSTREKAQCWIEDYYSQCFRYKIDFEEEKVWFITKHDNFPPSVIKNWDKMYDEVGTVEYFSIEERDVL